MKLRNLNLYVCCWVIGSLFFGGCAILKKQGNKQDLIRNVVVLPVANQTNDLAAASLVRYFLKKKASGRGYKIELSFQEMDAMLRQMGITEGDQVNPSNIQQIGQTLRADALFQVTLLDYHQDIARKTTSIQARFQLVETYTGRILWYQESGLEEEGILKVPFKQEVRLDQSDAELRKLSKSKAAALPKKLVNEAVKTLPSPKKLQR